MFDIAGTELLLLILLAVIFVGPKDLPRLMRSLGAFVRKARMMARDFQRSLEDMANETDLADFKKQAQDIKKQALDAKKEVSDGLKPAVDPVISGSEAKKTPKRRKK
ncbi:MAG: Sec-independent protein translocase protein TatB [Sphingomonadales bacterium]